MKSSNKLHIKCAYNYVLHCVGGNNCSWMSVAFAQVNQIFLELFLESKAIKHCWYSMQIRRAVWSGAEETLKCYEE